MITGNPRLMIVAGEPSGDLHAARLIRAISREFFGVSAFGMGGEEMRGAGAEIIHDSGPLDVIGFGDVPRVIPALYRIKRDLIARVREERPEAVVLVDYPGFNLSLAKSLGKLPRPPRLIYFIPPQVWAWRGGRARTIAEIFDLILTIYPFEPGLFRQEGGAAEFIGNPVAFALQEAPSREAARASLGIPGDARVVAFLPGSRRREIERLLGPMIDSAGPLSERFPGTLFLVSEAEALPEGAVRSRLPSGGGGVRVVRGLQHEVIRAADAAAVASGTATLECGLLGTPMSVCYMGDFFTYMLTKYFLLQVDYISLVNLLAGREVVPELYQGQVRGERIAAALGPLLADPAARESQTSAFGEIRESLGGPNPYERGASEIIRVLEGAS